MALNLNIGGGPRGPRRSDERLLFGGLHDGNQHIRYPFYMYRDGDDPILVRGTEEEEQARVDGFDSISASVLSNKYLINWYWDLEDLSARQLVVFCREEYGVELPIEAGQNHLFQAAVKLSRAAPQNQNRLVLMAHTIELEYDATIDEIRRLMDVPNSDHYETETTTMEFYA